MASRKGYPDPNDHQLVGFMGGIGRYIGTLRDGWTLGETKVYETGMVLG